MISVWGITDRGILRKENQDTCCFGTYDDAGAWGIVCDGMGGANAGDIASRTAAQVFLKSVNSLNELSAGQINDALRRLSAEANRAVYDLAQSSEEYRGMGTTLVGAVIKEGKLFAVNIGDSRAYHISGREIRQITRDHSLVEEMVEQGNLTPEQARRHPQRNLITRAIGTTPSVPADLFELALSEKDAVLLCSDGLSSVLEDDEIRVLVRSAETPEEACRMLVGEVLRRGAPDNVSVVLFRV